MSVDRGSYRELSNLPSWLLLDGEDVVLASVRARSGEEAREIFKGGGLSGAKIRRAEWAVPACAFCGQPVAEDVDYRLVTGWERMKRSAGGTNAIRVPDRSIRRYACRWCVDKLANGISTEQATFEIDA